MRGINETIGGLPADKRLQLVAAGVVCGTLAFMLAQTLGKAFRPQGYDFSAYLYGARALLDGSNPYVFDRTFPYVYPLFLALLVIPIALMPYWLANVAWFLASAACLVVAFWVLLKIGAREIKTALGWHLAVPGLVLFLFLLSPIQNNFLNGQANTIVLFCCVMFLRSFVDNKPVSSGIWLGSAITLKVVPAILLLFLITRRSYRVMLWTAIFVVVFCLLPIVVTGPKLFTYYGHYIDSFALTRLTGADRGVDTWLFFTLDRNIEYFFPSAGARIWTRFASLLVTVAAVVAVDLTSLRSGRPRRDIWSFCAYLVGLLLISPMSETHHLVFATPAVVLIGLKALFDPTWATIRVVSLMACFAVCFAGLANVLPKTPFYFLSLVMLLTLVLLAAKQPCDAVDLSHGEPMTAKHA